MPVLDTSFLVDLERGNPVARAALAELAGQDLVVPGHVALEMMAGQDQPLATLGLLRASYRVVLAADEQLAVGAAIRNRIRKAGRRPAWGDLYIAAEATLESTYVVTADARDFKAMGCEVWEYRKGGNPPA